MFKLVLEKAKQQESRLLIELVEESHMDGEIQKYRALGELREIHEL